MGGFQARLDDGPLLALPAKAQALLAYLAARPGLAHPRDKLAALLWGGAGQEQARSNLRHTLFTIRKAVRGLSREVLVAEAQAVALEPPAVDTDVLTFEKLVAEGTAEASERAAALYQGELLEGLSVDEPPFEEWLLAERELLRELALEALARVLAHQSKSQATERAIQTAIRLLAFDPLQEAAHRALMRLYVRQGRRAAALRQYQICVDLLQRELEAEPESETKQLYLEILQRRPMKAKRQLSPTEAPARLSDPPRRVESPHHQTPLIGREAELGRLRRALHDAGQGRESVVVVLGEAGIGKSRVVEEISAEASAYGRLILLGRCYESQQILPFGPWVAALRAAQVASSPEVLDRLEQAWRVELARLLPELGPADISSGDRDSYVRLFEALAQLLSTLAAMRPVVVTIEDLHWADEMSLRLLSFLARRLEGHAVLFIGTARLEELQETRALRRALEELTAESRVTRLTLTALSQRDTGVLVEALVPSDKRPSKIADIAPRVWALSEGNPFMIIEATRALREGSPIETADGLLLPERVREMIVGQLARLTDLSRELVGVAALIGREFEFPVLRAAAGVSARAAARGIEELVRRRVLHGLGERLDFAHDRIREVARDGILAPHRKLLHARIARALENAYAQNLEPHFEALGLHYREGEVWKKAAHYLRQSGLKAAARSAVRDARIWFEQALDTLRTLPESQSTLEAAFDVRLELRAVLTQLGEGRRALQPMREAEALAERLKDERRQSRVYAVLANTHTLLGDVDEAVAAGIRAWTIARAVGDLESQIQSRLCLQQAHYFQGDCARVAELARENLAALPAERVHDSFGGMAPASIHSRYWLSRSLKRLGRFDEASEHTAEALRLAEPMRHAYSIGMIDLAAARLHLWKGDWTDALLRLDKGILVLRAANIAFLVPDMVASTAWAAAQLGQQREALKRISEARLLLDGLVERGMVMSSPFLALARACLLLGRLSETAELGHLALRSSSGYSADVRHLLGDLATHDDQFDPETGESQYRQALALAEARGMRPLVAHCHLGLSKLYRRTGQREQAQDHLTTATTMYGEMSMTYWLEQAAKEFETT